MEMEQINGYWVDENNNRWDCELYSEAKAERYSKTLIDCTDCTDCIDCTDCTGCYHCNNCNYCDHCDYCYHCDYCGHCDYCEFCYHCYHCGHCDNFKTNPQVYKTKKIGSRKSQTIFYYGETDKGMEVQVVCGCFKGNLEEFETAVMKTHKNCDEYREQYFSEIGKVKVLFDLD